MKRRIIQLTLNKRANLVDVFYSPVICLIKLAILLQIGNIFAPSRTRLYWVICGLATLTVMYYFATMVARILACIPREKIWNPSVPGVCINSAAAIVASAALNTISDIVLLILPLRSIWRLQMRLQRKMQLSTLFATALL